MLLLRKVREHSYCSTFKIQNSTFLTVLVQFLTDFFEVLISTVDLESCCNKALGTFRPHFKSKQDFCGKFASLVHETFEVISISFL